MGWDEISFPSPKAGKHFLAAFKEGAGLFHCLLLSAFKATRIIYCDRETGAGGFRNVFSQMWSLLRSLFGLISAGEDAVGNENVHSMSTLKQFGFDLMHAGRIYLIASRHWFNSKTIHTLMHVYTHTHRLKVILNGLWSPSFHNHHKLSSVFSAFPPFIQYPPPSLLLLIVLQQKRSS